MNSPIKKSTHYFSLFDFLPDGIAVVDNQFQIVYWNKAISFATKIDASSIIGKNIFLSFPRMNKPIYRKRFEQVLEGGPPAIFSPRIHQYLIPYHSVDGKEIKQECILNDYVDQTTDKHFAILVVKDLTETINRIDQLKVLSQLKDDFLAVCSHDLKTPLSIINGYCEILSREPDVPEYRQGHLNKIKKATNDLVLLINNLLDLSQLNAGKRHIKMGPLNLVEIVQFCVEPFTVLTKDKGIKLIFNNKIPGEAPIQGNEAELKRIINNLLSNATKFTNHGGSITVTIKFDSHPDDIILSVADSGIGISPENIPLLFEKYSKSSRSGTVGEKGTGLGLSIVKEIVTLHNGSVEVASVINEGTTFSITIPIDQRSNFYREPSETQMNAKKSTTDILVTPLKILIVDDDSDIRELYKSYLNKTLHIVEIAENGAIAIEKFKTANYDLCIMDMNMPDKNGVETTREIRAWEKEKQVTPTPIIVVTSCNNSSTIENFKKVGCSSYLNKPVEKELFLQAIELYTL